jgi:hypothetical protein
MRTSIIIIKELRKKKQDTTNIQFVKKKEEMSYSFSINNGKTERQTQKHIDILEKTKMTGRNESFFFCTLKKKENKDRDKYFKRSYIIQLYRYIYI